MEIKLFEAEYKLMELVWANAPVGSTQLVVLAQQELNWKKSTTYTVVRKLVGRGVLQNTNAIITPLVTRTDVLRAKGEELVEKSGGLPLFLTAFLDGRKLSEQERTALQRLIDESRG